jgi:hypothetical protein
MKYLQSVIPGHASSPEPNDTCPHCGQSKPIVELMESAHAGPISIRGVIDRGCEKCVRERNAW